mgnify:CR=1 FL=1
MTSPKNFNLIIFSNLYFRMKKLLSVNWHENIGSAGLIRIFKIFSSIEIFISGISHFLFMSEEVSSDENILGYVSLAGLSRQLIKIQFKNGSVGFVGVKKMEGILMGYKRYANVLSFNYLKTPPKETVDSKQIIKEIENLRNLHDAGKIKYSEYLTKSEKLRVQLYSARNRKNGKNSNGKGNRAKVC